MHREGKNKFFIRLFLYLIAFVLSISLVRNTRYQGQDFEVYYKAAKAFLEGGSIYGYLEGFQSGGMIFKYPPWIITLILPFTLFSIETAKWIWGFFNLILMFWLFVVLNNQFKKPLTIAAAFLFYWGIWIVHSLDGQIALFVLVSALGCLQSSKPFVCATGAFFLSSKVYWLSALFGLKKAFKNELKFPPDVNFQFAIKTGVYFLFIVSTLLFLIGLFPGEHQFQWSRLIQDWIGAAFSGGTDLSLGKIRGIDNQGLQAAFGRFFSVESSQLIFDRVGGVIFWFFGIFFGLYYSKNYTAFNRLAVFLALAPVFHPLSWNHSFVLAFPLFALSFVIFTSNWRNMRAHSLIVFFTGIFFLCFTSRKILGDTLGEYVLNFSPKSIGILFLVLFLYFEKSSSLGTKLR